ncbi:MAG: methyl-accepting chemotaxis protein [Planctomycetes bacterium]|nr:methyl-accepting chemotaxis protein [Planctomycetota bacterium]
MRFPIALQLALLAAIPLCLALWIGLGRINDLRNDTNVADGMARRAVLMQATTRLLGALQRERGATFMAAQGSAGADPAEPRRGSDAALADWRGPAMAARWQEIPDPGELESGLAALRGGGGPAHSVLAGYNKLVDRLVGVQFAIANAPTTRGLGKQLSAAAMVDNARDHAGLVRARLGAAAAADRPLPDDEFEALQRDFSQVVAMLGSDQITLSAEGLRRLRQLQASPELEAVDRALDTITARRAAGGYGLDARTVFAQASAIVDGMGAIIEQEAEAVTARARVLTAEQRREMLTTVAVFSTCMAATLALSWWLALGITRGLGRARQRLGEVAEGRIAATSLPAGSLERLARRPDELGDLGRDLAAASAYLAGMTRAATALAAGDLRCSVQVHGAQDELGGAFAAMVANLRRTIGEIGQTSQTLAAAANELAATSRQLTGNAEESQTAAAGSATAANQGVAQVQSLAASAEELSASVREVAGSSQRMAAQMGGAAQAARAMGVAAAKVGGIATAIGDIAEQTNLLALNAAIEAAAAGDAGRGFAVVAGEVKTLAHQVASASADIQRLVAEMAPQIQAVDQGMGGSLSAAQGIAAAVEEQAATTAGMAGGLGETAGGLGEIVHGVELVAGQVREVAQGSTHVATTADELDRAAQRLKAIIAGFQLGQDARP